MHVNVVVTIVIATYMAHTMYVVFPSEAIHQRICSMINMISPCG